MDEIRDNVEEWNNDMIKDNILKLKNKQLIDMKNASYLNNFYSLINLRNNLKVHNIDEVWRYGLDEELNTFHRHIDKYIEFVVKGIEGNLDLKDIDNLLFMRNELYKYSYIIEGYLMELSIQRELLDSYAIKLLSTNYKNDNIDNMMEILNTLLDKAEKDSDYYTKINSYIINILPFRITRGNFYDILEDTLKRNLRKYNKVNLDNIIKYFKKQFNAVVYDGYGTKFLPYFVEIEKIKKLNKTVLTSEEIGRYLEEIDNLDHELRDILSVIRLLGVSNSKNTVISILDEVSIQPDVEREYKIWLEKLENNQNLDGYNLKIQEKISEKGNAIMDDIVEIQRYLDLLLDKDQEEYYEFTKGLDHYRKVLLYYNDINFSKIEEMEEIDRTIVEKNYLELSVDSLVEYIDRTSINMDNSERKIRMRKILSTVEQPFNKRSDLIDYIEYALDPKILSKGEIAFISNQLIFFIKSELENIKS